jgi:predicted deacylase
VLTIQNVKAEPGKVVYGQFRVDRVAIPLILAAGEQDGPTLVMHCAQHRTEFSGTVAAHELLSSFDFSQIRGTVVMLPLTDLPAIVSSRVKGAYAEQSAEMEKYRGQVRSNINRVWPGDAKGSWVDRLAYAVTNEVFAHASAVLDYHAARLCDGPFTAYLDTHDASRDLAFAFGCSLLDENDATSLPPGQLHRTIPRHLDIPAILIETSPASKFVTNDVAVAMTRGALNAMKHLGILDGELELPPVQMIFGRTDPVHVFCAEHLGYFGACKRPGDMVKAGDLVGQLRSPVTFEILQEMHAPEDGAMPSVGPDESMLVLPGEQVATFKRCREVRRNT